MRKCGLFTLRSGLRAAACLFTIGFGEWSNAGMLLSCHEHEYGTQPIYATGAMYRIRCKHSRAGLCHGLRVSVAAIDITCIPDGGGPHISHFKVAHSHPGSNPRHDVGI